MSSLAEDPHADIIFHNGVFYQEGIDGKEVAIVFDSPGTALSRGAMMSEAPPPPRTRAANARTARHRGASTPLSIDGRRSKRPRQTLGTVPA